MNDWQRNAARILALSGALWLAACGGGGNGADGDDHGGDVRIDSAGRLAVADKDSATVRVWELDDGKVVQSVALDNTPSALYTSPGGRYALATQRPQDLTQYIDGGLWREDHGNHLHDYRKPPSLMAWRLSGVRPTHYQSHGSRAALFMDGVDAEGKKAEIVTLTDASLGQGQADSRTPLALAMHGTAEPVGDYLLTTHRVAGSSSTLPVQVELHRRSGNGYSFVQRFEPLCPNLHGSASNARYTAFGCSDGVLVIAHGANGNFTARKLPNPADMPAGAGIGTLKGHGKAARFVGLASPGALFEIDPETGSFRRIDWARDRTVRAHLFDRSGTRYLVLDNLGTMHTLSAANGFAPQASSTVVAQMPTAAPFPRMVTSLARDEVFVSDIAARQIAVVDPATAAVRKRLELGFAPTALAWLGVAQ